MESAKQSIGARCGPLLVSISCTPHGHAERWEHGIDATHIARSGALQEARRRRATRPIDGSGSQAPYADGLTDAVNSRHLAASFSRRRACPLAVMRGIHPTRGDGASSSRGRRSEGAQPHRWR